MDERHEPGPPPPTPAGPPRPEHGLRLLGRILAREWILERRRDEPDPPPPRTGGRGRVRRIPE